MSAAKLVTFNFLALACVLCLVDLAVAQPGNRGRGGFYRGGSSIGLLMREDIQQELDLVNNQMDEIRQINEEMRREMMDMFSGMRDMDRSERQQRMEQMRTDWENKAKGYEKRLDTVLMPHQQSRLKQLLVQSQNRRYGMSGLADNDDLAEQLKISKEQREKMKEVAEQANKELQEQIAKLRKKAQEKVLAVLDSDQRAKYKELVGDTYDFGEQRGFAQRQRPDRNRENQRPGRDN